ncbi:MAG: aminotransferase class V-fold PLP-dependent enzyme [Acidobacteriota bacterium]
MENKINDLPNSFLQLSNEQMRTLGYRIIDQLVDHFTTLAEKPVTRVARRIDLEARLREPLPEVGRDFNQVLDQLQADVWNHIMHLDHPRFFGFVPSPSNYVSVMADLLVAGFNPFAGTWLEASGPAQIELVTIDWLRQLAGFPETAGGHFVTGGSAANLTALAVARHIKLNDQIENAIIYFSDQTHSSIERALKILGFAPQQICKLPCDEQYRLSVAELQQTIVKDRAAGKRPFCIVANAGTTNTGAVDPLPVLAELCKREGLWLHVDGAYGAASVLSEIGRRLLIGLELADSLSIDPHKWLFQPYEIGCVLLRDAHLLKQTFHILPEYLEDTSKAVEEVNFCEQGIQLTRSFRALKIWLSFKVFGISAFRAAIDQGIKLAELAEQTLSQSSCWEVIAPAQLGIVSFRFVRDGASTDELKALNQRLISKTIEDGFAFISSTTLKGRTALRLCTINPRTTAADISATIQRLEQYANNLLSE